MENNKYLYGITVGDVQAIASDYLNRSLTSDELEIFEHKFSIHDWTDEVRQTLIELFNDEGDNNDY